MDLTGLKGHALQYARKSHKLGIGLSKARRILVNKIIRKYFENENGHVICYRCKEEIKMSELLTLDHHESWFSSEDPLKTYLDLSRVSASHFGCNTDCRAKRACTDAARNKRPKDPQTGQFMKVGSNEKTSNKEATK